MSPTDASNRPSQVTVAGWAVAIGSVLLIAGVFDSMTNLHSVATRDEVTRALTSRSGKGLGISVDDALTAMRWALFVSGAAAAAAAVLGVFVLQRNKGARIGLSVAAVPILLVSPITGSVMGMFVAAGTAILWTRPARDWFAGRPVTPRPVRRQEGSPGPTQEHAPTSAAPAAPTAWVPPAEQPSPQDGPPPMAGWGQVPLPPAPYSYPYGPPVPLQRPPRSPMPRQVRTACIITWVLSGLASLAYLVVIVAIIVDSDGLLARVKDSPRWDQSVSDDVMITAALVGSVLFLLWSLAAIVLAYFAWRGASWAWILLSVSAGLAALVSILGFPYSLVFLAGILTCLRLLLMRSSREWFAGR